MFIYCYSIFIYLEMSYSTSNIPKKILLMLDRVLHFKRILIYNPPPNAKNCHTVPNFTQKHQVNASQ